MPKCEATKFWSAETLKCLNAKITNLRMLDANMLKMPKMSKCWKRCENDTQCCITNRMLKF